MKITRTSISSGITRTLDIPVTQEQIDQWEAGALIQVVMPRLTEEQREFMITGMTSKDWDKFWNEFWGGDEDEDYDDEPAF